jgi:type VI secretion system protein ImpL
VIVVFEVLLALGIVLGVVAALLIVRARSAPRPPTAASGDDTPAAPGWFTTALQAIDYARTRRAWRYRLPWILLLGERGAGKTSFCMSAGALAQSQPDPRYASLNVPGSVCTVMNRGLLIDVDGSVSASLAAGALSASVASAPMAGSVAWGNGASSVTAAPVSVAAATPAGPTTLAATAANGATASLALGTTSATGAASTAAPTAASFPGKTAAASPAASSKKISSRWQSLLSSLVDLRPERPIDGVVLTVSARTLLNADSATLTRLAADAYRQLCDVQDTFRFIQPVSVVVTQCDLIDGFTAFWRAQPDAVRQQMFGWSAPVLAHNDTPREWCQAAFSGVTDALRVLQIDSAARAPATPVAANAKIAPNAPNTANLSDAANAAAARDGVLLFPTRLDDLREPLAQWLGQAFRATLDRPGHQCRGIYFTGDPDGSGLAPRDHVAFVTGLLDDKVFAEQGNARVVRASAWSRNRYLRGFQVAAIGVAAALTLGLGIAGARLYTTVRVLDRALVQLQTVQPYSGGVCPSASEISTLLMAVRDLNTRSFDVANPWSWPWFWHPLRDGAADVVAGRVFAGVVLPALGCQLTVRAQDLLARGAREPAATGDNSDNSERVTHARTALYTQLRAVTDLEDSLGTFEKVARPLSGAASEEDLARFARLVNFAYGLPVSLVLNDGDRGLLATALGAASTPYRLNQPANLADLYTSQLARMEGELRDALVAEASAGQTLLNDLAAGRGDPAAQTRQVVGWLDWTRDNWLGSTEQQAQHNLCGQIRTDLRQQIQQLVLVHSSSGRPRGVPVAGTDNGAYASPYSRLYGDTAETFSTAGCDTPVYAALDKLSVPPYDPLIVRAQGERIFNPAFSAEFTGLTALSQLHFMQATQQREAFACSADGSGTSGWNPDSLGDASAYIDEYRRFAQRFSLQPANAPGPRPLYGQIAARQLENALNHALNRAQRERPASIGVWPVSTGSTALSPIPFDEQALAQASRELSRSLSPLISIERSYSEFGYAGSFAAVSGCLQQFAANRLSTVSSLAVQSQLYRPQINAAGPEFFELGTVPVTRDYLARQVGRAQVLASYAAPFATLSQNSGNPANAGPNAQTAAYWSHSIAEVNRYVPSNDPASQMGQLATLFVDRLNGMTADNCSARLQSNPAASGDGDNNLFAALHRSLVTYTQLRCQGSDADAFQSIFALFDATLARRYPFGLAGTSEASPLAVRDFFATYAQQSATLRAQLRQLPKSQQAPVRDFLDRLDEAQQFFAATQRPDGSLAVHLNATFNARPGAERGADQVVGWMLSSASQSAAYPNGQSGLDWVAGQPLALDLTWADLSRWAPYANPALPDAPEVDGRTATFGASGAWALMRFVQRHASERGVTPADGVTLRFSVPIATSASVAATSASASGTAAPPLVSAGNALLMLTLQLQGVDATSHAAVPLKLPLFPVAAPTLHGTQPGYRGLVTSAQIPTIPSIPPLPPELDAQPANTTAAIQGGQ